jgi:hypothetical protein
MLKAEKLNKVCKNVLKAEKVCKGDLKPCAIPIKIIFIRFSIIAIIILCKVLYQDIINYIFIFWACMICNL